MPPRQMMNRCTTPLMLAAALLTAGSGAWGQDTATETARRAGGEAETETGVTTASGVIVPELDDLRPGRAPLLREGSHLVEVAGAMRKDDLSGEWRFHVNRDDPDAPGYVLTMLPSTLLGEMVAIVESSLSAQVIFEATGEVFVYRTKNYFLPTHPPRLLRHQAADTADAPAPDQPAPGNDAAPAPGTAPGTGDSVEDMMRQLDEAVGTTAPPSAVKTPARGADPAGGAQSRTLGGGAAREENLLREGTIVLSRRGQVRRDRGGAWVFVFDADATGLADPPLTLLPCLLLERIESQMRRRGDNVPVLLSGHVYVYEGRNYVMPSVYRIPHEGSSLAPR